MAIPYEASSNLDGFRDGFQRVPRQATFGNSCWGLGPRHFCNGFRTGSGRVPTGSEAVHFSKFVLAPRPQALLRRVPDGFRRVPTQCTLRISCSLRKRTSLRQCLRSLWRRGDHKAILRDEMSSPQFIVENKNVLQAHVDGAILGQSATQLYTY